MCCKWMFEKLRLHCSILCARRRLLVRLDMIPSRLVVEAWMTFFSSVAWQKNDGIFCIISHGIVTSIGHFELHIKCLND